MSQRGQVSISPVPNPKVRNESEDLGRDPVDRGEAVPPGPDQAEDFKSVPFESSDLKESTHKWPVIRLRFVRSPDLSLVGNHRGACKLECQPPLDREMLHAIRTYFASKIASCRIFLDVSKW